MALSAGTLTQGSLGAAGEGVKGDVPAIGQKTLYTALENLQNGPRWTLQMEPGASALALPSARRVHLRAGARDRRSGGPAIRLRRRDKGSAGIFSEATPVPR